MNSMQSSSVSCVMTLEVNAVTACVGYELSNLGYAFVDLKFANSHEN